MCCSWIPLRSDQPIQRTIEHTTAVESEEIMASGDAQRVWFPEMLDELEHAWATGLCWDELVVFCHRMTDKGNAIRAWRGISKPLFRCPKCGVVARSDTKVSIRSALFALQKIGAVTETERKALDKSWRDFRKEKRLDPYGRAELPPHTEESESHSCH